MKLFRISTILTLLIAAVFGVLLFWTSQDVQKQERELAKAKRELTQERETIRVLSVEWDYLNRPQRIEELATELGMKMPIAQEVMVSGVNEIPVPISEPAQNAIAQLQEEVTQPVAEEAEEKSFEYPDYPKYVVPASVSAPSLYPAVAAPVQAQPVQAKPEILSPSSAERNSFDRLIDSLDREGAQ